MYACVSSTTSAGKIGRVASRTFSIDPRFVLALASSALVVGHFLPWVRPASAALSLSAHELAVVTNFTPHAGVFFNEGFLLPLWAAAMMIAADARRRPVPFLLVLLLVFLGLPGYPELRRIVDGQGSEFLLQLLVSVGLLPLCAALVMQAHPRAMVLCIAAALGAVAAVVNVAGFLVVRVVALGPLYGMDIIPGAGMWVTVGAAILCLLVAAFATIAPKYGLSPPSERSTDRQK